MKSLDLIAVLVSFCKTRKETLLYLIISSSISLLVYFNLFYDKIKAKNSHLLINFSYLRAALFID